MSNKLLPNQKLKVGERLTSENGNFFLILQSDGNLVLYAIEADGRHTALNSSRTHGQEATILWYQTDGNLVLYSMSGAAIWASNTYGTTPFKAIVQNDGRFSMYLASDRP